MSGSTPQTPPETMRAIGFSPAFCAASADATTTAADAERREPVLALSLAELGDERERETRTGRAERMAKRDRAAVHVRLLAIEAKLFLDGEVLGRERFVDLDEIYVLDLETGALQRLPARRCGADAHDVRVHAAHAA